MHIVSVTASMLVLFAWLLAMAVLHPMRAVGFPRALPMAWPKLPLPDLPGIFPLAGSGLLYRRPGERVWLAVARGGFPGSRTGPQSHPGPGAGRAALLWCTCVVAAVAWAEGGAEQAGRSLDLTLPRCSV